ncbi:MAG: hypothetical protein M1459_02110 [Patescibacteria group bacterium]|nr:hypothetical protein [Patescibacteria group bacterium]
MTVSEAINLAIQNFQSGPFQIVLHILVTIAPIFLVVFLYFVMWDLWTQYVKADYLFKNKRTLLELRLPKDTFKSPLAMETFLNSLHNTSDGSKFKQYWNGEGRPFYSLEIVSVEGNVKFYIWTEAARKAGVISALYSQFPEIEIEERPDYASSVHFDPKVIRIWAGEMTFTKKPNEPYPIKTYVDYGLDKDPKEEYKVDPMTPLIEFLGSVPPNQQVWIQIMITAHRKGKKAGFFMKETDLWEESVKKLMNSLMIRNEKTKVSGDKSETGFLISPTLSQVEKDIIAALERRLTKHAFDVGIRALYIAPKDEFNTPFGIGGIVSSFKHFSAAHMNGFKPNGKVWHSKLESPWHDYKNMRRNKFGRLGLAAYKRRSYFFEPFKKTPLVLNSEELATIYHFPGSVAATPSLTRVPSKKSEAPANLPVK